jgi:Domain of unknown function (DUF4173)
MKKKDLILIALTACWSYLFYQETAGINLSIFTLLLVSGVFISQKQVRKNKQWLIVASCTIVSAFSVAVYGNSLAIWANVIALILLTGWSTEVHSSVLVALIQGLLSWLTAPVYIFLDNRRKQDENARFSKYKKGLLIAIFPFIIMLVFFQLYRSSNPIFESLTNAINFNWISWEWVFFTLLGLVFTYGFYNAKKIDVIELLDNQTAYTIQEKLVHPLRILEKEIPFADEFLSGKILFILLNCLIFFVNVGDFNFIFIDNTLPKGITFASFLHQGVGTLIVSILISILLILFYFRGELNFSKQQKTIKTLAILWILQNCLLLISVTFKNAMYIDVYGLTYKRIGVYVYVFLTFVGLLTTIYKIQKIKSSLHLVYLNGWSFFLVLIITSLVNWDSFILQTNRSIKRDIDMYYLISLSDATIPEVRYIIHKMNDKEKRTRCLKYLDNKTYRFKENYKMYSWKSWNYADAKVYNELKNTKVTFATDIYEPYE